MKFEHEYDYLIKDEEVRADDIPELKDLLKQRGSLGWELVNVNLRPNVEGCFYLFWKRPVEE